MYFSHDDRLTTFFGPAYLKVYQLETKTAIYPRIIIDHEIVNGIELKYTLDSKDGEKFIDYLEFGRNNPGFIEQNINRHKEELSGLRKTTTGGTLYLSSVYLSDWDYGKCFQCILFDMDSTVFDRSIRIVFNPNSN